MGNPLITGTSFKQVNIMKKFTQMSKKSAVSERHIAVSVKIFGFDNYITHNLKVQSGAGVPPPLLHFSLLLLTFQKSTRKLVKSE